MAAKKKSRQRRGKRQSARGGVGQRLLVGLAGMVLVLCAASITQGFFFRGDNDPKRIADQFRIEVLNGTGKPGLAHAVRRCLLRKGIDVTDARNADSFDYEQTVLIARRPGADVGKLGTLLGCSNIVSQHKKGKIPADATLILGADYRELELDWHLESDLLK